MIVGVGLGFALTAGTAHADSTPLGNGVGKVVGDVKKVTGTVVKKKAPTARPKAVRKPVRRPAAKPAKRIVRSPRPQAKPPRITRKVRVHIPAPAKKKAISPIRTKINKHRPAKIVKRAPVKINKPVTQKIDKPLVKKVTRSATKTAEQARKKINKPVAKALPVDPTAIQPPDIQLPAVELPPVALPPIDLPAIDLPILNLPAVEIPPVQVPPAPGDVSAPLPMRSAQVSAQPTTGSFESLGSLAADRVPGPWIQVDTPTVAPATSVRPVAGRIATKLVRSVVNLGDEASAVVSQMSAGTSTALLVAAAIGVVAATSSAGAGASGWAGMALLPAGLRRSAIGMRRRFNAALRLSPWRISFRPAFAPD